MPYRKSKPWGIVKPAPGSGLDYGDPVSRGMAARFVFNGNSSLDSCSGIRGTLSGVTWKASGANFTATTDYFDTGCLANFGWKSAGTVAWSMTPRFAFNDNLQHYFWGQLNTAAQPEFSAQKFTDNNMYIGWDTLAHADRVVVAASAANFTQGLQQDYVLTWGANGSFLYRNGVQIGTNSTAPTVASPTNTMYLGRGNGTASIINGLADGQIWWWFAVNGYQMRSSQVAALFTQPYSGMLMPRRRIISQVVAAGGATRPVKMAGYWGGFAGESGGFAG